MSVWHEPSPSDFDRWEALIAEGKDPSAAAKELEFRGSSAFKRANPARHGEAMDYWRELRVEYTDDCGDRWASDPEASDQMRLAWLKRWNTAWAGGGTSRLELTGADGGPVESEDRSASLADVARVLEAVGALPGVRSGTPRADVPDARPVLPAPADS